MFHSFRYFFLKDFSVIFNFIFYKYYPYLVVIIPLFDLDSMNYKLLSL